ncbi:hypothetical protein [Actinocorallia populi]|uniref:hypothetical protein n=1 Tax=Actinocorallia populi TaxID=2079200 RepID=UPI000D08C173|nr:hypothetical protein [Actinocorallia populi]
MYVIRLANGRLLVPHGELTESDEIVQAYVEIGPDDPDYERFAEKARTEEELAGMRERWRRDDEALRLQFEEWKANLPEESTGPGTPPGPVGD